MNIYTLTRQKKYASSNYTILTLEQAKFKTKLLSEFIAAQWGTSSPTLYESIDQEALEQYEAFIDPHVLSGQPAPTSAPSSSAPETATVSSKVCRNCEEEKPLDQYYSRSESKDGKHSKCKECMVLEARSRKTQKGLPTPTDESFTAVAPC